MDIAPFQALRYIDTDELDRRVSLPYDQFGDAGRDERYARHPHNVVRLIKPRPEDAPAHEMARRTLQQWRDEGVLATDPAGVYPYRQRSSPNAGGERHERWAFISKLRLTPFAAGPLKPHEHTYADTVGERSNLRELVGADLGLILVIYDDPDGSIDAAVREASVVPPMLCAVDEAANHNALWHWPSGDRVASLQESLAVAGGFIADGHHRYTAALHHWQSRGSDPDDAAAWVMAAMVSAASPGLRILPTHRLTEAVPDDEHDTAWRCAGLTIEPLAVESTPVALASAVEEALAGAGSVHAIAVVRRAAGGLRGDLLRAPRGSLSAAVWPADVPESWRTLDVTVLHSLVLEPLLGTALGGQTDDHGVIDYNNDVAESVAMVADGSKGAAFLLNPLQVADVHRVVAAGDVLPHKSTNFSPKVIAGLTIHSFRDEEA